MLGFHIRKSHILFKFLGKSKPKNSGDKKTRQTFICTDCTFETSSSETLFRHVQQKHRKPDLDLADSEQQKFGDSDRKNLSKMFECNLCEYSSSKAYNLHRHYNRVHLEVKMISCGFCSDEFGDQSSLESHLQMKHDEKKKKTSSNAR